jgi:sensor domain CHASE-containing protein
MLTDRLFARSARPSGPRADSAPSRWHHGPWWSNSYLLTPLLSILVFLVVMSLILWSLNRREQQQQEDTLYRNVAWAQQQIRLSMTGAQEQLQALARDIAAGHGDQHSFEVSTADIMQAHPEILYLNWYTVQKTPRWPNTPLPLAGQRFARLTDVQMDEAVKAAFADARATRRQIYSSLIYDDLGNGYLTLQTPIYRDREFLGSIAAVFSIEGILKHDIPPELSAKY